MDKRYDNHKDTGIPNWSVSNQSWLNRLTLIELNLHEFRYAKRILTYHKASDKIVSDMYDCMIMSNGFSELFTENWTSL